MNRTRLAVAATAALSVLTLGACGGDSDALSSGDTTPAPSDTIVVGSANFSENVLLGEVYAAALAAKGVKVSKKLNLGSREVYLKALEDGSIDLVPEYNGYLLAYYDPKASGLDADATLSALKSKLPATLSVLDQAAAEDTDAVVVTKATADKYGLTKISDLAPVAKNLTLGGPPEWKTRATGVPGLKKVYGLTFKKFRSLDAGGPLTISALGKDQVQAANVFTTNANIPAKNLVVLQDDKHLFLTANVIPLLTKAKASGTVSAALNAVTAKLTQEALIDLDKQVDVDKKDPATVAKDWLTSNGLA